MRVLGACFSLLFVASCSLDSGAKHSIEFADETSERGIHYVYESGGTPKFRLPEILGGGVALIDVDQDDDLDIYLVQSGSLDATGRKPPNVLYRNDGDAYFTSTTAGDATRHLGYGMGVAVGDVNADALPDMFVTQLGQNVLLLNVGDGKFEDATARSGFPELGWSTAATFTDLDLDGDLDLWVVDYIEWSEAIEPECYQTMLGSRDYCSPSHYNRPAQDRVFRNDGQGTFTDVTSRAGVLGTKGNGLGVVAADFNGDGLPDVFVANDTSPHHLWLNQGDFQFVDAAATWNCAVDQHGTTRAGMGIVATDLDDDADEDVIVVNITTEPDSVFRNENDYFRDVTALVGLNVVSQRYTRFGLAADDLNNDGWLDVFEANGAVARLSETTSGDMFAEPNVLYQGTPSGRFTVVDHAGHIRTSRGLAVGELTGDGLLDLVVVNRDAALSLLINQSSDQNWLLFDIRDQLGRPAIGSRVSLTLGERTVTRTVRRDGSYLASRDPKVHFGLGSATEVSDIVVHWVSGETQRFSRLAANQIVAVHAQDS